MISSLAGIVETITGFFQQLVDSGYLTLDYIFYVSLALELILIIFFLIKSSYSYELRLDRSLDGLNRWLYYNQYIDESNLIEFNQKIKKSPKLLRYHWQQYMLYRDSEPSHYMSEYNCIEKPLHTSSFTSNIKNLANICYTIAAATFLLNLASYGASSSYGFGYVLLNTLLTPVAILLFSTFFTILLRSWQNANLSGLYQNFHLFTRYIDKGCTTLPEYIDFEVLFTKEEIKKGIPVLNEYLEKRARQEQKELEQAMQNSVEHEEYDFSQLGLNGSQILDRAMKETEIYLNFRQRTVAEIRQLEGEIESAKRNYENNQKEYERKMQASKENVDRLRKQQEESTNRIESNYIRKQQTDEIKKQEQLEKDYESTTMRYNQEVNSLTSEINARNLELEEKKKSLEESMKAEYKTFSTRVFKAINDDVQEKEKTEKSKLLEERENYSSMLSRVNEVVEEKEREIKTLQEILKKSNIDLGEHGEFYDENLRKEATIRRGKDKKEPLAEAKQETKAEVKKEEPVTTAPTQPVEEPVYDEYGGYYDSLGYYRYKNGTYYDPEGNFFDEFGGHYDKDGNYFPPNEVKEEIAKPQEEKVYDEFGAYRDEEGNYRYKDGTYYDVNGTFHAVEETPVVTETLQEEEKAEEVEVAPVEEVVSEESETEESEAEESEAEESEKRGRGRPRKEPAVQEEISAEKRGRGRPRKTEDAEPVIVEKKNGRGRPKKATSDEDEGKKMVKKAGRGRPRKTTADEEKPKPAGKRGRPKKNASETMIDELDEISMQIQKENEKLKQQHDDLSNQINSTLNNLEEMKETKDEAK